MQLVVVPITNMFLKYSEVGNSLVDPLVVVLRVSTTSKSYKRVELYVIVAVFIDQQC